jgi:hypothetical protein
MPVAIPELKPRLSYSRLIELIAPYKLDTKANPLFIIGIRGYYLDSLGEAEKNDRNMYDDAIFIMAPQVTASYNANTDPSIWRKPTNSKKGVATLCPGIYFAHKFDNHKGSSSSYPAICQRLGPVTIVRDGSLLPETGNNFGINIHRGGFNSTSSEGCQTIYPNQWDSFYNLAKDQAKRLFGQNWNKKVIPYILIENNGQIWKSNN